MNTPNEQPRQPGVPTPPPSRKGKLDLTVRRLVVENLSLVDEAGKERAELYTTDGGKRVVMRLCNDRLHTISLVADSRTGELSLQVLDGQQGRHLLRFGLLRRQSALGARIQPVLEINGEVINLCGAGSGSSTRSRRRRRRAAVADPVLP